MQKVWTCSVGKDTLNTCVIFGTKFYIFIASHILLLFQVDIAHLQQNVLKTFSGGVDASRDQPKGKVEADAVSEPIIISSCKILKEKKEVQPVQGLHEKLSTVRAATDVCYAFLCHCLEIAVVLSL